MSKRKEVSNVNCRKLLCFASKLSCTNGKPQISYFDTVIEKEEEKEVIMMTPFYVGAIEILEEFDPLIWIKLWKGDELSDDNDMEALVSMTCQYFGLSMSLFAHFFVPHCQNLELTEYYLMRNVEYKDIARVIFDFVINYKVAELTGVSKENYILLN